MSYKTGKIYKICSNMTDKIYIGSTRNTLKKRFSSHTCGGGNCKTSYEYIQKYPDAYIELLFNFPCESKKKLEQIEGKIQKYIPNCINKRIAGRSYIEYYQDNKITIRAKNKKYYLKNIDKYHQHLKDNRKNACARSHKYYQDNKKIMSDKNKKYRDENKEKINKNNKIRILCSVCGKSVGKTNIRRHQKSAKCLK